jgi:hypothetical protein
MKNALKKKYIITRIIVSCIQCERATTNNYIRLYKLVASVPRLDAIDGIGHRVPSREL